MQLVFYHTRRAESPSKEKPYPTFHPIKKDSSDFGNDLSQTLYLGGYNSAIVRLSFSGKYNFTGKNNLLIEMLDQALSIRLRNRLREVEGATYHVTTNCYKKPDLDGNYFFVVTFNCDIGNVDRMINATKEEVNKLKSDGLDSKLLDEVKQRIIVLRQQKLKTPRFWSEYLTHQYANGLNPDHIIKEPGLLEMIDLETINKAAKKYLLDDKMMRFVMLPEEVAGKKEKAAIGELGEAHFQQLPVDSPASIFVTSADYFRVKYPEAVYVIQRNSKFFVEVEVPDRGNIFGKVLSNGRPLAGVKISIDTIHFNSDSSGRFSFVVPGNMQKQTYTIDFYKEGYDTFSISCIRLWTRNWELI